LSVAPTLLTAALAPRRWTRRLGVAPPAGPPSFSTAPGWTDGLVRREPGPQRSDGVLVEQVDAATCGAAVLVVLRAALDARYRRAVAGPRLGADRLGTAQLRVHRESTRWWPRALGTSPWGMARWLRAAGVAETRVRLVDAADGADLAAVVVEVDAAVSAGWAVPLLVGSLVPRHWCLVLPGFPSGGWLAYEPSSGSVRRVPAAAVTERRLRPLLGFDDLQAVLLPRAVSGTGGPRRAGRPTRPAAP
jgi:hypothetical protein